MTAGNYEVEGRLTMCEAVQEKDIKSSILKKNWDEESKAVCP